MTAQRVSSAVWVDACAESDVPTERGVAVLIDGCQVALFRTYDGQLFALANRDPFSGANVLARGIVGTRGAAPTVTAPIYKQAFDLATGQCLDVAGVAVTTYGVRVQAGRIEVLL